MPLITLESLSKTHLVPGWRVGWMRYTHERQMRDLTEAIGRLASGRLCSPTPAQYAVAPALEGSREFQKDFLREIKSRRDLCVDRIRNNEGLSCEIPAAAFYLMIKAEKLGGRTDEQFVLGTVGRNGRAGGTRFRIRNGSQARLFSDGLPGRRGYARRRFQPHRSIHGEWTLRNGFSRKDANGGNLA